jgi:hypothetical protein
MFNLTNLCGFMAYHAEEAGGPVFGSGDWSPADAQPLSWGGSSWDYDGDYGGCDDCVRGIKPSPGSTWQIGFRPGSVAISITTSENWASGDLRFSMNTTDGSYGYQEAMPVGYQAAGSNILVFDLTDPAYLLGVLGDIVYLGVLFGRNGDTGDRSFQITDISFS